MTELASCQESLRSLKTIARAFLGLAAFLLIMYVVAETKR